MSNYIKTKHLKRLFKLLILLVCSIIILVSVIDVAFFQKKNYVTANDMKSYAQAFASSYNQDISFFNQIERNYFYLYSASGYNVTSFISSSYGTAILLIPSESWTFENNNVEQRVEEAVFGGDFQTFPMLKIPPYGHNIVIMAIGADKGNGTFITNGHPFIELGYNSSVIVESLTVNSNFYPLIILKGNNDSSNWNIETAKDDARQVFESDLAYVLSNSEEVRARYAEPVLQALIRNVVDKWQDRTSNYSYLQKRDDLENIKKIAQTQYGVTNSSDFISNILTYVQGQIPPTPPPPKTIFFINVGNDDGNWWYVAGWVFLPLFAYTFYLSRQYLKNRFHSNELNFWFGVVYGGFLTPCFTSLLVNHPYDYSLLSLQTGIIITALIVGFL